MTDTHLDLLPPPVRALVSEAFGGAPITGSATTFGGFSNLTIAATVGNQRCVIKAATLRDKRADVRREVAVLRALHTSDLPTAHLLAFVDNADWSVAVTAALPGRNGLQVATTTPEALPNVYAALGRALGATHAQSAPPLSDDLALTARIARAKDALPQLIADDATRATVEASLAHPVWCTDSPRLVHGDAGLHNVLWDETRLYLLDWEWSSVGQPLLDVAWLRWTLRWRNFPETLWQAFLTRYQAVAGPLPTTDAATLRALMLGQIAMILQQTHAQPAAFAEWTRRTAWTLALDNAAIGTLGD